MPFIYIINIDTDSYVYMPFFTNPVWSCPSFLTSLDTPFSACLMTDPKWSTLLATVLKDHLTREGFSHAMSPFVGDRTCSPYISL